MQHLKDIDYILFDAANTLIHKPLLWTYMLEVLELHGYMVPIEELQQRHKFLSEIINFPDRTSKDFYTQFNSELLLSLGIIPNDNLLDDLFNKCSYLPWQKFEDTRWLENCNLPIGVLSNFNNKLPQVLDELFGNIFSDIIVSEHLQIRKPDILFFQYALKEINIPAGRILYVGDSLKLDIIPALKVGLHVLLIDRLTLYNYSEYKISNLTQIPLFLS